MGNLFCSDGSEPVKPSAVMEAHRPNNKDDQPAVEDILVSVVPPQEEQLHLLKKEQARLELIVSSAGRDMVSVRTNRASHYYNDQGFAAALSQHLQQTLSGEKTSKTELPPPSGDIIAVLGRPVASQKNVDHVMERCVSEQLSVTKEQLFSGYKPIVENLL